MAKQTEGNDCVGFECLDKEQIRKIAHKGGEVLKKKMDEEGGK